MWNSSWITRLFFFVGEIQLFLSLFLVQLKYYIFTVQSSLCIKMRLPPSRQSYSVWFISRAKRTTPALLRGSGLSSGGCGSPPAALWEWWWLGRRTSSLASLGGSTWLRQQRRRQKETHDEAFLQGQAQEGNGAELSTLWPLISESVCERFGSTLGFLFLFLCFPQILLYIPRADFW